VRRAYANGRLKPTKTRLSTRAVPLQAVVVRYVRRVAVVKRNANVAAGENGARRRGQERTKMTWDRPALTRLRNILARLYPAERDARRVVVDAGLDPTRIAFDGTAINTWFSILEEAAKHAGKIDALVATALLDYPDDETLRRAAEGTPPPVVEGPEPTDWRGPKGPAQLEKVIGTESTLVPISYLELGLLKARSVAKVRLADGGAGTGFLTADGVLITNNHVLSDEATARGATAIFNYQQTVTGTSAEADERALLPDEFFETSASDDWSAVRVAENPNDHWGSLAMTPARIGVGDRVNIIQHPNGLPKQISFYSNVVVFVGADRVQYLTDTEPGSSGSPVFDRKWNVVALHHSGGWMPEPGAANPTRQYYRNEGILIDAVIAGLADSSSGR
jgi:Trypsin-like peptidase domain/Effector-associated domain 1